MSRLSLGVAHVLLERAKMLRLLALLPLAVVCGCLYTGTRNDPPGMTIELSPTVGYRGQLISANVIVEDDQDDADVVRQLMKIRLLDANQQPVEDDCTGTVVQAMSGAQLFIYTPGHYFVEATSSDELGAVATTTTPIDVVDAAPVFTLGARPQADSLPNACNAYTAGQPIVVQLAGKASDADADPIPPANATCHLVDETLTYTWAVVTAPVGAQPLLGPLVAGGCPGAPAGAGPTLTLPDSEQICLYTDPAVASDTAGYYALDVSVSDGVNPPVVSGKQTGVAVISDQPPCIAGTIPGAGLRVVDRTVPQTFTITGVIDDLDPYPSPLLTFVWSVWRTSDPTWRAVDLDDPTYTLDTSGFDVGETVQVRVEVVDRTGTRANCSIDTDQCLEASCLVEEPQQPNSCLRWMTWSLELR